MEVEMAKGSKSKGAPSSKASGAEDMRTGEAALTIAVDVPSVAATWEPIDSVTPWAGNPRVNSGAVARIAASIIRWGWGAPLVARAANRELAAGHTRHKAARKLRAMYRAAPDTDRGDGITPKSAWHVDAIRTATDGVVPVRFLELSESEAHAYALADNKLGEISAWDPEALVREMGAFDLDTVATMGWTQDDLQKLLGDLAPDATGDDERPGKGANEVDKVATRFELVITCTSEKHQRELIEWAQEQGLTFRALV
jgi:ParB-like chromosome segregation protein Spo0J